MTRRHTVKSADSRRRLIRTASAMLVEKLDDTPDTVDLTHESEALAARLVAVGVTNARPVYLEEHARAMDAIDGLTTTRYDVERYVGDDPYNGTETRDALVRGFEVNLDYAEDLMAVEV